MNKRWGTIFVGSWLVFSLAVSASGDDAKTKKTALEGTWKAVKADGIAQQLKFTGNKFEATIDGKVFKGTFKLNDAKDPMWIDMKITESPEEKVKGKTALGIYEFNGQNIRWCSCPPGLKKRPTEFATTMGDARLLLETFKKTK